MNLISRFIVVLYHMIIDCQDPIVAVLGPHNGPVSYRTHGTTEAGQVGLEPTSLTATD